MKSRTMSGTGIHLWRTCLAFFIILSLSLSACSSEEESNPVLSSESQAQNEQESQAQGEAEISVSPSLDQYSPGEALGGIIDRGKECIDHHYVLPAGANETLSFSTLLPSNEKKRPTEFKEDESSIRGTDVSVRLNSVSYEDFTESYSVWVLDYGQHFQDVMAEAEKRKKQRPNDHYEIQIPMDVQIGSFRIGLNHDLSKGVAVIRKLGNYNSPESVGKLSREEVAQLLGLQSAYDTISYEDKFINKQVTVSLVESSRERANTVMKYSVLVRTPENGGIRDTRQRTMRFVPDSGRGMGVGITSMWGSNPDPNALYFIISGPAKDAHCH